MMFFPISPDYPLILASASPRRKALLSQVGLPFTAIHSMVQEENAGKDPEELVRLLSGKKAHKVREAGTKGWILGADTVVVIDHAILGKPKNSTDAACMLAVLSGREHRVVTGFCVLDPGGKEVHSEAVTTWVSIAPLNRDEIGGYVATGEPFGKAGSYAIQGIGAFLVEAIRGSYSNVVGLPVSAVIRALRKAGALEAFPIVLKKHPRQEHP